VVVAYLADGRWKLPKGTPVFNIGDEETTGSAPSEEPVRQPMPTTQTPATADPTGSLR
jgi:hypothetical protein